MHTENEDKVQLDALREDICTVCKSLGLPCGLLLSGPSTKNLFVLSLILIASFLIL